MNSTKKGEDGKEQKGLWRSLTVLVAEPPSQGIENLESILRPDRKHAEIIRYPELELLLAESDREKNPPKFTTAAPRNRSRKEIPLLLSHTCCPDWRRRRESGTGTSCSPSPNEESVSCLFSGFDSGRRKFRFFYSQRLKLKGKFCCACRPLFCKKGKKNQIIYLEQKRETI